MGILSGDHRKNPLHYGEVFTLWSFVLAGKGAIAAYETLSNHTGDRDLKNLVEDLIHSKKRETKEMEEILKANGIALPPSPPERPIANLDKIPAGARFNDPEISAQISKNIGESLVAASQAIAQTTREDIAIMFGQCHMNAAQFGAKVLRMNKEKGWLVPPPLHLTDD